MLLLSHSSPEIKPQYATIHEFCAVVYPVTAYITTAALCGLFYGISDHCFPRRTLTRPVQRKDSPRWADFYDMCVSTHLISLIPGISPNCLRHPLNFRPCTKKNAQFKETTKGLTKQKQLSWKQVDVVDGLPQWSRLLYTACNGYQCEDKGLQGLMGESNWWVRRGSMGS